MVETLQPLECTEFGREILALIARGDLRGPALGWRRCNAIAAAERRSWHRGGAETMIAFGTVRVGAVPQHVDWEIIAKAYAGFGPPEMHVHSWAARADCLANAGLNVPRLFGICEGVAFMEYIDHEPIGTLGAELTAMRQDALCNEFTKLVSGLEALGARPLCVLPDLAVVGDSLCFLDFGEDLGMLPVEPPNSGFATQVVLRELRAVNRLLFERVAQRIKGENIGG